MLTCHKLVTKPPFIVLPDYATNDMFALSYLFSFFVFKSSVVLLVPKCACSFLAYHSLDAEGIIIIRVVLLSPSVIRVSGLIEYSLMLWTL
jgi:hypothetical protein